MTDERISAKLTEDLEEGKHPLEIVGEVLDDMVSGLDEPIEDRRVAEDHIHLDDGTHLWVSTVLLGYYYETMVFEVVDDVVDYTDLDVRTYDSEAEALTGHTAMVVKWQKSTP